MFDRMMRDQAPPNTELGLTALRAAGQFNVEPQQDGLVRLSLKRAFADGTVAVDMDPLSLLCRLAASVPPPRFHTVKYAGVLASASRPRWRASASDRALRSHKSLRRRTMTPLRNASVAAIGRSTNRAELLRRTFAIDVLECPTCKGRMKRVAMVTEPRNIARFLSALGEPTDVPARSPNRGPPYWKSTVLRRKALGDAAERLATRLPGQTNARTDTCAHGTPMRPVARSAPPRTTLFRPRTEPSRRSRLHPSGLLRYTSSRCDPASFTYAPVCSPSRWSAARGTRRPPRDETERGGTLLDDVAGGGLP
ncbi:transposase [Sorangium sp. So ce1151]|uniref:transposase n=1 Tax=Sorangium sp. So ce1151 TaxID=3133332 RepID=UPI003F61D12B